MSKLHYYLVFSYGFEEVYISSKDGISYVADNCNIQPGDVIFFNNGSEKNGGWHHAAIVTKVEAGMIYYAAHSSNAYDKPLSDGIGSDTVSIVRIDIGG